MKKLSLAFMLATLVGCASHTTPAPQVTYAQPATVKVCAVESRQSGKPNQILNKTVMLKDYGDKFEVINMGNQTLSVSPTLGAPVNNIRSAEDNIGLVYSKGVNQYEGMYSRTAAIGPNKFWSIFFSCF